VNGDRFDLDRFLTAQGPVFQNVVDELRQGRKRSHWMWFIFPQLRGLGSSSASRYYGIASLDEARAYVAHPILGQRLAECSEIVTTTEHAASLRAIFGTPDDLKFHSSMTLFAIASDDEHSVFRRALARWCSGRLDPATVELLRTMRAIPDDAL
jgi:uncharacterized protein (DUF1810 family)